MSLITIVHNAVNAKVVGADRNAKLHIREALSYLVPGAEHMGKGSGWDGRSSFFDFRSETFPAGFVHLIHATLLRQKYKVGVKRSPFPVPLGPDHPVVDKFGNDPKYSYQMDVVRKLEKFGQIIAQVATGGGKSRIAKLAYSRIGRKTMFLTTRGILMHQMKDAVQRDMNQAVGVIGDDEWIERPGFNVCMVQTLAPLMSPLTEEQELNRLLAVREQQEDAEIVALVAKLRKLRKSVQEIAQETSKMRSALTAARKPNSELVAQVQNTVARHTQRRADALAFLKSVEFVILEEAHESSGDGYYEILRNCPNAHYRLSLTATPFMKEDQEANMRLMACSGPIAIKVSEEELINLGILAKPYFKFIPAINQTPEYTDKDGRKHRLYRSTPWPKCYEIGVVHNQERNGQIVAEARRAVAHGLSVMVLTTHTAHGKALQSMLQGAGLSVNFIWGTHSQEERQAALNALKDRRIDVLIGSTILDVGVDVPAVGMVILAGGGKAEVAMRQRIGRGLRAKREGPNVCLVVDFTEPSNNTLREHSANRIGIIKSTPGFNTNIVTEFDYQKLGFGLKAAA